ncbi:MAG: 2-amino-4-hydroxy-6-hydroxymethyldihydropteridine diphosphokinase [Actinomycetales bacterium]|nr:2-amino-4-hydroxy-6-hydroxymethyldihydropteridine diphosphokinase [Actinomycetales bacterium]
MTAIENHATAEREPARVVLALGANLGDPDQALRAAAQAIAAEPGIEIIAASHIYRTDPVGGPEQPVYANAVLIVQTTRQAADLLALAHRIEQDWGRVREVRWGPRTLDIDIIAYGEAESTDERLTLPHPRAHERAFVLVPWLEADVDATLAGRGPVAGLVAGMETAGVEMTEVPLV